MGGGGGAWKVAYADFVTAMMAFFMVMWLTGQSPQTKKAIAGYFQDPWGTSSEYSAPASSDRCSAGSGPSAAGPNATLPGR